jgi:hypothetical protein
LKPELIIYVISTTPNVLNTAGYGAKVTAAMQFSAFYVMEITDEM